jgi:hypothetical protein
MSCNFVEKKQADGQNIDVDSVWVEELLRLVCFLIAAIG